MIALQTSQYHYHWPNYQVSSPPSFGDIESIKKKILHQFLNKMKIYHTNNKNMTDSELIKILKELSSGGVVGDQIITTLNSLNFTSNEEGKSSLGTASVFNNQIAALEPYIPDEVSRVTEAMNWLLNDIIDVLWASELDIMAIQLTQVKSGTPVSQVLQNIPVTVSNGAYPETQLSLASLKVKGSLEKLQICMNELSKLGEPNGSSNLTLEDIKSSLEGVFSKIAGELYEPVTAHAMNIVGNKIWKQKKEIDQWFAHSGGILRAIQSGTETKESGAQKKNDVELTYTKNGITYSIGGTIKLRQGKQDLKGSGSIQNLHGGMTLGKLVELTLSDTGQSQLGQYYAAMLGAIKTTQSNRSRFFDNRSSNYNAGLNSWIEMKNAATLSGLALGLSGTGEYGDFSGVLVYNNIIYSIYDLLEKALYYDNNGIANITGSITPANLFSQDTFNSVHQRILNTAKELNKTKGINIGTIIGARQRFTASEIQELWNKKIEINFSFANLVY